MNKIKAIAFVGLLVFVTCLSAQDYVWTGGNGNNDFFDELNWEDPTTNKSPADGSIDAGVNIDYALLIENNLETIAANGNIAFGQGMLTVKEATLSANSIVNGALYIQNEGYVQLNSSTPLSGNATIDFIGELGWVKLPDVLPLDVLSTYLLNFLVSGVSASYPGTIRIDNYYEGGALLRVKSSSTAPLTIYSSSSLQGSLSSVTIDVVHNGNAIPGGLNNAVASFRLQRGFMATFAVNEDGTGKSKVYIASESDLVINQLPVQLQGAISFIRVVPWNWVSKKGIGGNVTGLNETWHYNWGNQGVSTLARENTPMSWGRNGSVDDKIALYKGKYKATHVLAFNESDNCNDQSGKYGSLCQTDTAVKYYNNLMKTGLRLVSPSCRENAPFGWLKEFYDKATAQDIRIDVIGVHWYDWGSSPKNSPNEDPQRVFNRFKKYLQSVYDLYQLPIWLTEFNANPNRTAAVNKAFMELALPYLETLDYVERYAWFEPSSDVADYYIGSSYTEVGMIYKNHSSTPSVPEDTYTSTSNLNVIELDTSVGGGIYGNEGRLKIYPNPVSDILSIVRQDNATPFRKVEVISLNGEVVLVCENKSSIDVSSLHAGVYFIRSGSEVAKFIKR